MLCENQMPFYTSSILGSIWSSLALVHLITSIILYSCTFIKCNKSIIIARIAKTNFVSILNSDFSWFCGGEDVIDNVIWAHHLFHHNQLFVTHQSSNWYCTPMKLWAVGATLCFWQKLCVIFQSKLQNTAPITLCTNFRSMSGAQKYCNITKSPHTKCGLHIVRAIQNNLHKCVKVICRIEKVLA